MARPRLHAAVTLICLGAAGQQLSWLERSAFAAGSLLVDLDHLVDLALYYHAGQRRWRVLPLHGWELGGLLTLAGLWHSTSRRWRLASLAGIGLLLHLALDQLTNRPANPAYFWLGYRLGHRFAAVRLGPSQGDGGWLDRPWWRWL
jgi:hypothetical protein